jgi:KaiC/GvpD/RAD55 family RecA-like ATPase/DNA-binding NarL/FixJ family response regulator
LIQKSETFGIRVLDERVGGPVSGGLHAVIGGPGTGKTVAALQFLREGIRGGGRVAMLTQARPADVIELAQSIGIDLSAHLRAGSWLLLGYQSGFRERYRRSIEPGEVFEELAGFVREEGVPDRLVIDTCGPLVTARESGNGAEMLVDLLGELGTMVMLTFAAEHPGALDSSFDFISQRASLILHFTLSPEGRREIVVRKTVGPSQSAGPITFDIREGLGMVPPEMVRQKRRSDMTPDVRRRVLLLDITGELPEELRLWLEGTFELVHTTDAVDAFPELAQREFGLVVVHVDRRTVKRGLHVMHQLRRAAGRPPILLMSRVVVRASDRAVALRSGADDFVSGGLNPEELASRMEALLRRGRTEVEPEAKEAEPPATVESKDAPRPGVSGHPKEVRETVRAQLKAAGAPIFSLVVLRPAKGRGLHALATHVAEQMRQETGDRMCVNDQQVEVYLHGAMASHAEKFLKRVMIDPFNEVDAEVYTSPTDRERLLKVMRQ